MVLYIDYAQTKQSPDALLFATYRRWFALGIGVTVLLLLVARRGPPIPISHRFTC